MYLIGMPGGWEWIIILLAIVLLFGGKKIPELMRGVGKGIKEFNNAKANIKGEIEEGRKSKKKNLIKRAKNLQIQVTSYKIS